MAEVTMQPTPPGQGAVKRSEKSLVVKEEKGMIKQMSKFSTNLKKKTFMSDRSKQEIMKVYTFCRKADKAEGVPVYIGMGYSE